VSGIAEGSVLVRIVVPAHAVASGLARGIVLGVYEVADLADHEVARGTGDAELRAIGGELVESGIRVEGARRK
jgi:hypothetical protein